MSLVSLFSPHLATPLNMNRQDDKLNLPQLTILLWPLDNKCTQTKGSACTAIHKLWYGTTVTIHGAYRTFCTAALWNCLSDRGLVSFNTGLEVRPCPLEPNAVLLWDKIRREGNQRCWAGKRKYFYSHYTKSGFMFDSKTLHTEHDDLTEVKPQTKDDFIS